MFSNITLKIYKKKILYPQIKIKPSGIAHFQYVSLNYKFKLIGAQALLPESLKYAKNPYTF